MTKDKLRPRPIEVPQPGGYGQSGARQERMNVLTAAATLPLPCLTLTPFIYAKCGRTARVLA